jgi:hypothetical protein
MRAIDPEIKSLPLRIYAKDQPRYLQLPARVDDYGTAVTCWKLSLRERLQMLLRGRFYLTILTLNKPLQSLKLSMELEELEEAPSLGFKIQLDPQSCEKLA